MIDLQTETIQEFFKTRVEEVSRRRQVNLEVATQFYIVNLLSEFLDSRKLYASEDHDTKDEPLALIYAKALEAQDSAKRFSLLKCIGDRSLYVSGFFPDSFRRKLIDIDYYISMGENAYGAVSALSKESGNRVRTSFVFEDLATKFQLLVDLIGEISESSGMTSDQDLLRLYERWLHTKSERISSILRSKGIQVVGDTSEDLH